jgi:hypothetical protein
MTEFIKDIDRALMADACEVNEMDEVAYGCIIEEEDSTKPHLKKLNADCKCKIKESVRLANKYLKSL